MYVREGANTKDNVHVSRARQCACQYMLDSMHAVSAISSVCISRSIAYTKTSAVWQITSAIIIN